MSRHAFLLMGLTWAGTTQASDIISDVGGAITTSIHWQERWFGASFGADCVRKRAHHGASLTVFFPTGETALTEETRGRALAAYVDGSNVLYSGRLWPEKAAVEPSGGNRDTCGPGEIAPQVDFSQRSGTLKRGPFVLHTESDVKKVTSSESRKVAAMVMRSLNAYYAAKNSPLPDRVRLGEYGASDPFLIVMNDEGDEIYLLDFPPLESIDGKSVVSVYSGDVFIGPDMNTQERHLTKGHAVSELRKKSEIITRAGLE
jgi:hypothetical protein